MSYFVNERDEASRFAEYENGYRDGYNAALDPTNAEEMLDAIAAELVKLKQPLTPTKANGWQSIDPIRNAELGAAIREIIKIKEVLRHE